MWRPPVLYVEDEETDVFFVRLAFDKAGIRNPLKVLPNGELAIRYLAGTDEFADRGEHPLPCLVLLDLNLPIRSGFEVLQWIREHPELSGVKVLIFTSSAQASDLERARKLRADEYIVKPSCQTELRELIRGIWLRWLNSAPLM